MPKDKLTDYSATNASNTDVGGVNIDEGMLPSAVNNAIREVLTHLKNFASGTDGIDVLSLADDTATNAIKLQAPSSVTTTTTLTLPDGDGTDGQVLSTDGSGALSFVNTTPAPSLIINGDMAVAQRGTSETGLTSSQYANAPDRFKFGAYDGGTWTASQSTTSPDGFGNSYKLDCTTAKATLASDSNVLLYQRLEGQDLQQLQKGTSGAKSLTVSFYVRTNKTGTYTLELFDRDNTRVFSKTYSVSSADTWEYKSVTFEGDTTGAFGNDNAVSLDVIWWLVGGTDFTSGTFSTGWASRTDANRVISSQVNMADSTSNEWYITGVKLEVGNTATPFKHESYAENLAKCQRYYVQQTTHIQTPIGGSMIVPIYFPTTMRATPTTANVAAGSTAGGLTVEQIAGLHAQGAYFQVASSANSNYRINRIDEYIAEL